MNCKAQRNKLLMQAFALLQDAFYFLEEADNMEQEAFDVEKEAFETLPESAEETERYEFWEARANLTARARDNVEVTLNMVDAIIHDWALFFEGRK